MAATDNYASSGKSVIEPARGGFLITAHDTNELDQVTRAISFGTAGALAVVMQDGSDFIIPSGALAAGVMHPLRIKKVKSTGTTASGIVGYV